MTDQSLPGKQIAAKWSSGVPTLATSGASFVAGEEWGWYDGTLAVAALKAGRVVFMKFGAKGKFLGSRTPAALTGLRPAARRHRPAQRRPADHHRQRRRRRRAARPPGP